MCALEVPDKNRKIETEKRPCKGQSWKMVFAGAFDFPKRRYESVSRESFKFCVNSKTDIRYVNSY